MIVAHRADTIYFWKSILPGCKNAARAMVLLPCFNGVNNTP